MFEDDSTHRQAMADMSDHFDLSKHMETSYNVETSALHRKLQSKAEALRILRKELEQFRTERDQFKLMAETLQLRYSAIRRSSDLGSCGLGGGKSNAAILLHETRERNIKLTTEVEALKQKLKELQGDIDLLRSKEQRGTLQRRQSEIELEAAREMLQWKQERADFICHLEYLKKKNAQLAFDFKSLIDEKEELITERDAYKCKAHRLNHELFVALKANETHPKFLDIDSIILENKYLLERLKNVENELEMTKENMSKYKTMLETKRKKGIIKLGTNTNEENILSHKQVKAMLESGVALPIKTETIQDLKSLCVTLLDNLNDKNLALAHQKKTNKILATKLAELEQRIQILLGNDSDALCNGGYSPSELLLHGYCASMVDATSNANDSENAEPPLSPKANDALTTNSSEPEEPQDTLRVPSDDGLSSLSTESARSVLSSEYGIDAGVSSSLSEFARSALFVYKTPSSTTDSGNCGIKRNSPIIPNSIARERDDDLKDLPPELAAMVQSALHELDMRDFDEVLLDSCACAGEVTAGDITSVALETDDLEDDDTIH